MLYYNSPTTHQNPKLRKICLIMEILQWTNKTDFPDHAISTIAIMQLADLLGSDLNVYKYNEISLFESIIFKGEPDGVKYALDKVKYESKRYPSPFGCPFFNHSSFEKRNLDVLDVLLRYVRPNRSNSKNFFSINEKDQQGNTPLDTALNKTNFAYFQAKLFLNGARWSGEIARASESSDSEEASRLFPPIFDSLTISEIGSLILSVLSDSDDDFDDDFDDDTFPAIPATSALSDSDDNTSSDSDDDTLFAVSELSHSNDDTAPGID